MILVDTSVWIDHLRGGDPGLVALLEANQVGVHAFVVGELACGTLTRRTEVLGLLGALPSVSPASDSEVLFLIESQALMGRGIGYVDAHLLTSAILSGVNLWTRDRRLARITAALGCGADL